MYLWSNATFYAGNLSNATYIQRSETCDVLDYSFSVTIGLILVFSIILVISLVGNTLILVIVYKREDLRKTTNYFIVNMAVSDFIFPLTVIPTALTQIASSSLQWPIGDVAGLISCKAITFLRRASFTVSTGSLVFIALDRFVAVVFPMKVHLIASRHRRLLIATTWILAVIVNFFDLYVTELEEGNGNIICTYFNGVFSFKIYYIVRYTLFLTGPMIAITVFYCAIAVTLRKQDKSLRGSSVHQKDQRKQQAIKMTLCVIAAFYICNTPFICMHVILGENRCSFPKILLVVSRVLFYSYPTVNPIICFTFVKSYSQGFKELTMGWNKCFTARSNVEPSEPGEITLRHIRIIPGIRENRAFSVT